MTIITKDVGTEQIMYDWWVEVLADAAEGLEAKGIDIDTKPLGKGRKIADLDIDWEIQSSNSNVAFAARIRWAKFIEAYGEDMKQKVPQWYLLLVANPSYAYTGVTQAGRNSIRMEVETELDAPYITENGFFTGVDVAELGLDTIDLDRYVLDICEAESYTIYLALEQAYEWEVEQAQQYSIDNIIEEYRQPLQRFVGAMLLLGESFTRAQAVEYLAVDELDALEFDWDDVCVLGLIAHVHNTYKISDAGKELMS